MHDPEYILANSGHRPWPVPKRAWAIRMAWRNLLFAHWPVAAQQLRPLVPEPLTIDEFNGSAWIAVTPFTMDLHVRKVPVLKNTPELNVRTYVRYQDKPGVFFFSLDLSSAMGVWGARVGFGLPYWKATMQARISRRMQTGDADEWIAFQSQRATRPAEFRARYRHNGTAPTAPQPGSLEYFLTERYCLYNVEKGKVYRSDIAHLPWPLQTAEATVERNTVTEAAGIKLAAGEPLLHFARELDVLCWTPKRA
ncbi:MAG TPA: DUF2071 domain-containing protein [Terriglobales bacterium]|nr:DUF2071 domain-containing protein [Terriglobales bacterium]